MSRSVEPVGGHRPAPMACPLCGRLHRRRLDYCSTECRKRARRLLLLRLGRIDAPRRNTRANRVPGAFLDVVAEGEVCSSAAARSLGLPENVLLQMVRDRRERGWA